MLTNPGSACCASRNHGMSWRRSRPPRTTTSTAWPLLTQARRVGRPQGPGASPGFSSDRRRASGSRATRLRRGRRVASNPATRWTFERSRHAPAAEESHADCSSSNLHTSTHDSRPGAVDSWRCIGHRVEYGNHTRRPYPFRVLVRPNGNSPVLDLAGEEHDITSVEFWCDKAS